MGVASLLGYLDIEKNKKLEICFQFPENIAIFAIEIIITNFLKAIP